MKKILSLVLTAAMLLSAAVMTTGAADENIGFGEYVPNAPVVESKILDENGVDNQGVFYTLNDETQTAIVGKNTYADSASAVTESMSDSIIIPDIVISNEVEYTVTAIGRNAFDGSDIRKIVAYCGTIGEFAFAGCTELEYVYFTGAEVKGFAFWGCTSLTEAYVFDSDVIGGGAFWNCTGITNVSLSASVIMEKAFEGCDNLDYFVISGDAPSVAAGALGTAEKAYVISGATGYEDFPITVLEIDAPFLAVENIYAKAGETVEVAVTCPTGFAETVGEASAYTMSVVLTGDMTLEGINDNMCNAVSSAEGYVITFTPDEYTPGAVVNLLVKVPADATGRMEIAVNSDDFLTVKGSVTVCDHANTKTSTVKSASCDEAGVENTVCVACGDILDTVDVAAKGHTYKDFVIAPTCTEAGYTRHICECCSNAFTDADIEATGHAWNEGEVVVQATPSKEGQIKYTCTTCGTIEKVTIPKIVYGDANLDKNINVQDVTLVLKYIAKWNLTEATFSKYNADANADDVINVQDVTLMLKYIAKWNVQLGPQK